MTDRSLLTATSAFTSWDEVPGWGDDAPTPRLAHFALSYRADGTGTSQGFEMVTGTKDGVEGTFVVHHVDDFTAEGVGSHLTVVAGSGTGAFDGLTGTGSSQLGHGTKEWEWSLS